jgi:hypothetical protein
LIKKEEIDPLLGGALIRISSILILYQRAVGTISTTGNSVVGESAETDITIDYQKYHIDTIHATEASNSSVCPLELNNAHSTHSGVLTLHGSATSTSSTTSTTLTRRHTLATSVVPSSSTSTPLHRSNHPSSASAIFSINYYLAKFIWPNIFSASAIIYENFRTII